MGGNCRPDSRRTNSSGTASSVTVPGALGAPCFTTDAAPFRAAVSVVVAVVADERIRELSMVKTKADIPIDSCRHRNSVSTDPIYDYACGPDGPLLHLKYLHNDTCQPM